MRPPAILGLLVLAWGVICAWYYSRQESMVFHPSVLPAGHSFVFDRPFTEHEIEVEPGVMLSALLFRADPVAEESVDRPAVLYLHGNAGDLQSWGYHADLYTDAGYDFLGLDYRGYGKSDGRISSEAQLHSDVQKVWDWLAARYDANSIVVVGYSLGSALGARIACGNGARHLVLLAPFYSGRDIGRRVAPWLPAALNRYQLRTDLFLQDCKLPVTLVHGERDATIPPRASRRLLALLGDRGRLVLLPDVDHQNIAEDPEFRVAMREVLAGVGP
ncbi:MAG: alpha/beta fold hydrolase [Gemmatimonadales bacterium]|nr:MAG: alpha/beta fold hydrolase [Gemmatimonadales bacterium]